MPCILYSIPSLIYQYIPASCLISVDLKVKFIPRLESFIGLSQNRQSYFDGLWPSGRVRQQTGQVELDFKENKILTAL
jgi:hypothetical protein